MDLTTPQPVHRSLLSTITSTELRKVIFPVTCTGIHARGTGEWTFIDKLLCELVDRLRATGYHHTLEVEVRPKELGIGLEEYDFAKVLLRFREKGVVTIADSADSCIIPGEHLADHSNSFYR